MRALYLAYQDAAGIVPQAVGQLTEGGLPRVVAEISWGHNVVLLERLKEPAGRIWYARSARKHGWSRNVLMHRIESDLYQRKGKAETNFETQRGTAPAVGITHPWSGAATLVGRPVVAPGPGDLAAVCPPLRLRLGLELLDRPS